MSKNNSRYYIGLDLGTASIGWAVVNEKDKVIRKRGQKLWGVRLFNSAESAEKRRLHRRQRRTISKRNWRLSLLKKELQNYVLSEDKEFFQRLTNSQTKPEEGYFLFDGKYNDVNYMNEFSTIYHLRLALMDETRVKEYKKRNIYYRLLYLACNDILKTRGHFLSEGKLSTKTTASQEDILNYLKAILEQINEEDNYLDEKMIVKSIKEVLNKNDNINKHKRDPSTTFLKAILGYKFDINRIIKLNDEKYEHCFDDLEWEEKLTQVEEIDDLLQSLFELYSMIRLFLVLGDEPNISSSKVKIYENHKKQLRTLKKDIKQVDLLLKTNFYYELFEEKDVKKVSYSTYVGKIIVDGKKERIQKKANYDDFIKKIKAIKEKVNKKYKDNKLLKDIEEDNYLLTPTNADNRLIPYQIHYDELNKILEIFVKLENSKESQNIKERILKIMEFKVPYYVGPLSNKHTPKEGNYWLVKKEGYKNAKITPYNFDEVVDKQKTNEQFIRRMLRSCTYLYDEYCLQQETILYQTFIFYNTINKIKVNGISLTKDQKSLLYNALISSKSLSKSKLLSLLNLKGSEVTGFSRTDEEKPLSISLSAVKRFRNIFPEQINNEFYQTFYDDVVNEISFIDDNEIENKKEVIRRILKNYKTISITDEQMESLIKVKSQNWGNLSYKFLNELLLIKNESTGEMATIMDILKDSDLNLMEILFIDDNMSIIDKQNDVDVDLSTHENVHEYLKNKYISPQARRTIIQTVRLVDEIIQIMDGQTPENIAIEFTREREKERKETNPRLKELKSAYKNISEEYKQATAELDKLEKNKQVDKLRAKKIYLYFLQLGKDIYTGEEINFNSLLTNQMEYNIDHIFPQSRIKDDSFDNVVLTKSVINGKMGNNYPIPKKYQDENYSFWSYLVKKGLMSAKKFARLTRTTKLTDQELEDFVNRQKTTLDWINKETAELLKLKYAPNRDLKNFIIFSKSRHASDFRNMIKLYKFRELNDLHHAHDAYLNILIGKHIKKNLYVDFNGQFRTYNYKTIIERIDDRTKSYVKKIFKHHDVLITKKTEINNKGSFWDEQIVAPNKDGKNDNLIPLKEGMDVNLYGGYLSAKTAFFTILENDYNKVIMPIPRYHCEHFYDDENFNINRFELYVNEYYPNHKIIEPIIPINQKVVVDGVELLLAGKSDVRVSFHNTGQLLLDEETYEYMRKIIRFSNRNKGVKLNEEQLINSEITKENNLQAFLKIVERIKRGTETYQLFPNQTLGHLNFSDEIKEDFSKMSLMEQYNSLINIITRLTRPNSSNQGEIFGKKYNNLMKAQKIKYNFSIIKESITGFYNKKIDIHVQNSTH